MMIDYIICFIIFIIEEESRKYTKCELKDKTGYLFRKKKKNY